MEKTDELSAFKAYTKSDILSINSNLLTKEEINKKVIFLFIKRMIDIFGSIVGLIILAPLFLIVALAIKKEEKDGSVFFSQIRIGKDGNEFRMYKFRSMCMNAEDKLIHLLELNEVEGAMFKIKNDPRVTRIGRFIRKTSIDELPQLLNVLQGNMSLVGPRPPLVREVENYSTYDKQRLLVKPGCTGVWQISGRNDVGFDDMVELDVRYIRNLKILNDIKIILKTAWIMIKPNGAY